MNKEQLQRMKNDQGFIAALDQSGGSTPGALKSYGVSEDEYSNDAEMFDLVHQMRTRIFTSPAFTGEHILGAILFKVTMNSDVEGQGTADYLWGQNQIVPFLKVDNGLAEEEDGVQIMKPNPGLEDLLKQAKQKNIFGTKMRSVISSHNEEGIQKVVKQQFEVARQIISAGLVPIIEPEVDIHSSDKAACEATLKEMIATHLDELEEDQLVMLKLTLPEEENLYKEFTKHPNVVRVVALSGGYSIDEATDRLSKNNGVIASFNRALAEGLSADQSDQEFDDTLKANIEKIYKASIT